MLFTVEGFIERPMCTESVLIAARLIGTHPLNEILQIFILRLKGAVLL
jgi:hypothetical protein